MSTITLCPRCGGAMNAVTGSYVGRICSCSRGGVTTMVDASTTTAAGHKICCKCGTDVTHAKRMKDHFGRYWCYECGAADQLKRGSGLALKCPDCLKHFPPTKMLKHLEEYVCEECHANRQQRERGGKSAGVLLVLALLAGAVLAGMYAMGMI